MTAKELLTQHGLDRTYWGGIIIQAEEQGAFSDSARNEAREWATCACGRQDARIPRNSYGEPDDTELNNLGRSFYDFVQCNGPLNAAETLIDIERRSSEILAGLEK